jgi:hypothetical protein
VRLQEGHYNGFGANLTMHINSEIGSKFNRHYGDDMLKEDTPAPSVKEMADFYGVALPSGSMRALVPVRRVADQLWLLDLGRELTPHPVFGGENTLESVEFIAFCQRGGFVMRLGGVVVSCLYLWRQVCT